MTPLEMAVIIHGRFKFDESIWNFVLREMPSEKMSDLEEALNLCNGFRRGKEEIEALSDILRETGLGKPNEPLGKVISKQRASGYHPELEAILAKRWRCPTCKQLWTIEKVGMSFLPGSLLHCVCGAEGIYPIETETNMVVIEGGKS